MVALVVPRLALLEVPWTTAPVITHIITRKKDQSYMLWDNWRQSWTFLLSTRRGERELLERCAGRCQPWRGKRVAGLSLYDQKDC